MRRRAGRTSISVSTSTNASPAGGSGAGAAGSRPRTQPASALTSVSSSACVGETTQAAKPAAPTTRFAGTQKGGKAGAKLGDAADVPSRGERGGGGGISASEAAIAR